MARCGAGSRRQCEKLIQAGRVTVDGETARIGSTVRPGDRVLLDGKPLRPARELLYLAVHKPRGYLCSAADRHGRPVVHDLLPPLPARVFHVGRLDMDSSGLIFYTNDGRFANIVSHPSGGVKKVYVVETSAPVAEEALQAYRRGIRVGGEELRLSWYTLRGSRKVELTLIEGRNREIRRAFEHLGVPVRRIHRVRIGCVSVRGIPLGGFRTMGREEVEWFYRQAEERRGGGEH